MFSTALSTAVGSEDEIQIYLTILISLKYSLNWEYRNPNYWPLKILATKWPLSLSILTAIFRAATKSWLWMYWSISWNPVMSGAPSLMTKSTLFPLNASSIFFSVSFLVISPTMWCTFGMGAVYCKSTETILSPWMKEDDYLSMIIFGEEVFIGKFFSTDLTPTSGGTT